MRAATFAVLGLAAGLVMLVGVVLSFGLGLVFLFPPIVRLTRATAGHLRPPELDLPYRPAPLSGRHLAWHERLAWLINDPATWRDGVFLVANGLLLGTRRRRLAAALLAPTPRSRLAHQVNRLTQARADVVDHQAAELRRIERDLHDGAQSRMVAVGMTMNGAEELIDTDPRAAKALLAKGRETSQDALQELRRLIGGIHPPVLAERGLGDAIMALTLDYPLVADVTVDLPTRPEPSIESAAYFAVSELLTNVVRHADASTVWIDVGSRGSTLRITVTDDGRGGVDPAKGTGLAGLERRVAAFDGVLAVSSPAGGPTIVNVELPQALVTAAPTSPSRDLVGLVLFWGLFSIPLVHQGLVPMSFKLAHIEDRSWFLALHLPELLQWPVIGVMIGLGLLMVGLAIRFTVTYTRRRAECA